MEGPYRLNLGSGRELSGRLREVSGSASYQTPMDGSPLIHYNPVSESIKSLSCV